MCGIVGFAGTKDAFAFLKEGLKLLEYRGYDSAGITVLNKEFKTLKTINRVESLNDTAEKLSGSIGIGHTRWATHGSTTTENAHPHFSNNRKFAVVHNGIIENYVAIKEELISDGFVFESETDTEVIPNLLEKYYHGDLKSALFKVLCSLEGSYALGIICADFPDILIAAKSFSPLIIGLGMKENYISSDISAISGKTDRAIYLNDGEIAFIKSDSLTLYNSDGAEITPVITTASTAGESAEKGDFAHFMLKEIYEQPQVLRNLLNRYIKDGEIYINSLSFDIKKFDRIDIVACGSAYHVGVAAKYIFEDLLQKNVCVDFASEYRYRKPLTNGKTLTIAISQSGETADTVSAITEAKKRGSYTLSIVNTEQSTLSRITDDVIFTCAGSEIAVATTKGYLTQLTVIYLLAVLWAKRTGTVSKERLDNILKSLLEIPGKAEEILKNTDNLKSVAKKLKAATSAYFIGRNTSFAVCLEAALKLKEISYIHAESYPAGELKHGSIALIEKGTPVIVLCSKNSLLSKTVSNIKEVSARGGYITACCEDSEDIPANEIIKIPSTENLLAPLLQVIPFQLLAYYTALYRGCDIDKPRNLAKSVTVE